MNLQDVSTGRLIMELRLRNADTVDWEEGPRQASDLLLRYLNLTSIPAFVTLPDTWQNLIRDLGRSLELTHHLLDTVQAPARLDDLECTVLALEERLRLWLESHPEYPMERDELRSHIDSLQHEIENKNYLLQQYQAMLAAKDAGTEVYPARCCGSLDTNHDEFACFEQQIRDLTDHVNRNHRAYQTLLKITQGLGKQSTAAHEAMDAVGLQVCGVSLPDRVACLTKKLAEREAELAACHETLNRLAHDTKNLLKDK